MTTRLLLSLMLVVATGDAPASGISSVATGARIFRDARAGTLVLDLAPMDLPANTPHHGIAQPPVATLEIPESGSIYGFRVQVVDSAGHDLPDELIHHFNLIDPDHRELFLPISRRLLAAGHETGAIRLPRLLFGLPLKRGEHVVASAMVENLTPVAYRGARVRLVMSFTPEKRPWPLFSASPWQMDVAFPVGDKSFTLPQGHSSRAYEGSPAVPGKIVGLGGHMHDYGRVIEFADVTTGEVIYRAEPVADSSGRIASIPIAMLYGWTRADPRWRHGRRGRAVRARPRRDVAGGGAGGLALSRGLPALHAARGRRSSHDGNGEAHVHAHEDGRARARLARPPLSRRPTSSCSTSAARSKPTACTGVHAFTPPIAR